MGVCVHGSIGVFAPPHLLWDLVVPGFLVVLCRPSLRCLLAALSNLSDHHDPAEKSPTLSPSKSRLRTAYMFVFVNMDILCLPSCLGLPLILVFLVGPKETTLSQGQAQVVHTVSACIQTFSSTATTEKQLAVDWKLLNENN